MLLCRFSSNTLDLHPTLVKFKSNLTNGSINLHPFLVISRKKKTRKSMDGKSELFSLTRE